MMLPLFVASRTEAGNHRPSADGFGNIVIWQRFQDGCITGLKWFRREEN